MSASKVYFTDMRCPVGTGLLDKLKKLIEKAGIDSIDMDNKFVAIKIHFGEPGNLSFLRPNFAKVVADNDPADVDTLMNCKYPGTELTVSETMPEKVMSIGENLQIRRFVRFAENTSVGYVHAGGKIGVLVNLAVEGGVDATEIGKNVAMQIAALNPRFWDKSQVTEDVLAEEKKVALALMDSDPKMASKPAQVKEKIVMGKMNKFYEENCLLQMEFVRGDLFSGTVEQYIADAGKKLGGSVKFLTAVRYQTGEGIEKKEENFAAEVAAQMNQGK